MTTKSPAAAEAATAATETPKTRYKVTGKISGRQYTYLGAAATGAQAFNDAVNVYLEYHGIKFSGPTWIRVRKEWIAREVKLNVTQIARG